jgi:hypothetical protein
MDMSYAGDGMSVQGESEGVKPKDTAITPDTEHHGIEGQQVAFSVHGPARDSIRASGRGWEAAADIKNGMVELASASGNKSEGEDLTLDTAAILIRRLNADGAKWGKPISLPQREVDDCEAPDTRGHRLRYPPLRIQVTRPSMPEDFWNGITEGSEVPPGPIQDSVEALWGAIKKKRATAPANVVLAVNALRTPWFSLPSIVDAFRRQHGQEVRAMGFPEVWVVAWSEALTRRLYP